jgi:hypothetical protein
MRRCIALFFTVFVLLLGLAQPASAAGSDASQFASLVNSARAAAGLPAYAYAGDLADVALGQAQRMAARQAIYHNPNLATEVSNWRMVGENVGVGGTVDSLHDAFMNSPAHRANILSDQFTEIGVGSVVGDDGRMYVAEVFRLPDGGDAAAAPEPAPAPAAGAASPAPAAEPAPEAPPVTEPPAPVVTAPPVSPAPVQAVAATTQPLSAPRVHTQVAAAAVRPAAPANHGISIVVWLAAALALAVMGAHAFVVRARLAS